MGLILQIAEAIVDIIRRRQQLQREGRCGRDFPAGHDEGAPPGTMMRVDVRPHNDVKKLFITFAMSFLAVHQLIHSAMHPASIVAEGKTCVETEENNFFCTDDPAEARKRAKKTAQFYLQNFGVQQTIEGSGEENKKMRQVAADMEAYMKRWIVTYDNFESLKEKCINKHDKCVFWASIGECAKNPGYMETDCMLACRVCEKLLETPESKKDKEL